MKKTPLKNNVKARLSKEIKQQGLVNLLTRERDPEREWRKEMKRRWGSYTDEELDTQTVTLRKYLENEGKLLHELFYESSRHQRALMENLDEHICAENARTHQSERDKRIAELEAKHKAEIAKLTEERDAARLAYLELLDRQAERGEGGAK